MGWTYSFRAKGQSLKDFMAEKWDGDNEMGSWKVLDVARSSSDPQTHFVLFEIHRKASGHKEVVIVEILTQWDRSDEMYNFGYKDQPDLSDIGCPDRLLNRMSEPEEIHPENPSNASELAAWVEQCRTRNRKVAQVRQAMREQRMLYHPRGLKFVGFTKRQHHFKPEGRGNIFRLTNGMKVRLRTRALEQLEVANV